MRTKNELAEYILQTQAYIKKIRKTIEQQNQQDLIGLEYNYFILIKDSVEVLDNIAKRITSNERYKPKGSKCVTKREIEIAKEAIQELLNKY